jgi:hypothetical protein
VSGYGVDVSSQRADDLDALCLAHIGNKSAVNMLELGAGKGGQSVRMALAGARVTAVDTYDFASAYAQLRRQHKLGPSQLQFQAGDISTFVQTQPQEKYTDAIMQRVLHYLPYSEAVAVLTALHGMVEDTLFVSVTGLQSAIGAEYADAQKPVSERFCTLTPAQAELFSITQPICLYYPEEFRALLEQTGWQVQQCWESAFGNSKAVCTHSFRFDAL